MAKQKKISIPTDELEAAKEQAKKDGFGNNVTGWARWIIRKKCDPAETVGVQPSC
ncbi:hypothetical protein GX563_06565 [Candidatus Bathyarchaeota archaeon]|jgi:hypothetical protein|nr:hypothetical protein [Candidatus Bathyarchaeota archaeon]